MRDTLESFAEDLDKFNARLSVDIEQAGYIAGRQVTQEARSRAPKDTGELRKSITENVSQIQSGVSIIVSPIASYASNVEFGQPPGTFVSPEALKPWVRRHGMNEGAAYAISRAIMKRGTQAQPFLFPAFEAKENTIFAIISQGVQNAIKAIFK